MAALSGSDVATIRPQAKDPFTAVGPRVPLPNPYKGSPILAAGGQQFGGFCLAVPYPIKNKLFFFGDYQATAAKQWRNHQLPIPTARVVSTCNPATNQIVLRPAFCDLRRVPHRRNHTRRRASLQPKPGPGTPKRYPHWERWRPHAFLDELVNCAWSSTGFCRQLYSRYGQISPQAAASAGLIPLHPRSGD